MLSRAESSAVHFVARQPHPLLVHTTAKLSTTAASTATATESDSDESDEPQDDDSGFLLYHAAHHNDTVDPRDVAEYDAQTTTKCRHA